MNYLMLGANRIMNKVKEGIRKFWSDESGMGTVEIIRTFAEAFKEE